MMYGVLVKTKLGAMPFDKVEDGSAFRLYHDQTDAKQRQDELKLNHPHLDFGVFPFHAS